MRKIQNGLGAGLKEVDEIQDSRYVQCPVQTHKTHKTHETSVVVVNLVLKLYLGSH